MASEQCHQRYKTPLPLTCSIVWIMLSDHFNRLLGYRFSWLCRMRDEAGSWGGVLKNNTKCSISSLQSRGTGDKLPHTREENIHKTHSQNSTINTYIHTLYVYCYTDRPTKAHSNWKPCVKQIIHYPHSLLHSLHLLDQANGKSNTGTFNI